MRYNHNMCLVEECLKKKNPYFPEASGKFLVSLTNLFPVIPEPVCVFPVLQKSMSRENGLPLRVPHF